MPPRNEVVMAGANPVEGANLESAIRHEIAAACLKDATLLNHGQGEHFFNSLDVFMTEVHENYFWRKKKPTKVEEKYKPILTPIIIAGTPNGEYRFTKLQNDNIKILASDLAVLRHRVGSTGNSAYQLARDAAYTRGAKIDGEVRIGFLDDLSSLNCWLFNKQKGLAGRLKNINKADKEDDSDSLYPYAKKLYDAISKIKNPPVGDRNSVEYGILTSFLNYNLFGLVLGKFSEYYTDKLFALLEVGEMEIKNKSEELLNEFNEQRLAMIKPLIPYSVMKMSMKYLSTKYRSIKVPSYNQLLNLDHNATLDTGWADLCTLIKSCTVDATLKATKKIDDIDNLNAQKDLWNGKIDEIPAACFSNESLRIWTQKYIEVVDDILNINKLTIRKTNDNTINLDNKMIFIDKL